MVNPDPSESRFNSLWQWPGHEAHLLTFADEAVRTKSTNRWSSESSLMYRLGTKLPIPQASIMKAPMQPVGATRGEHLNGREAEPFI